MKVYHSLPDLTSSVLTIGSFDGVHLGHKYLIQETIGISQKHHTESVIVTFEPHPRLILPRHENFELLNTLDEKLELFSNCGIDAVVVIPFDQPFADQTAHAFVRNMLINHLRPIAVVLGYDHKFGKDRQGSLETFEQIKNEISESFEIYQVDEFTKSALRFNSTLIRQHIKLGNIDAANELLGHSYIIHGTVIEGKKIGRTIGYPTANIAIDHPKKLIPTDGVYDTEIIIDGQTYKAATSIGHNETISDHAAKTIESYILDFDSDVYGCDVELRFLAKIRDQKKYGSLEELKAQIAADVHLVKNNRS